MNKMLNKFYQFYCRHSLFYLHLGILAVAGILCLARHFTKNPAFTDYAYAVFVLDIFSVLIHQNQKGIYHYMRMNKDVSHVPKRQIYLINTLFLTGFLILTGGFIFLFVHALSWYLEWDQRFFRCDGPLDPAVYLPQGSFAGRGDRS